jgi:LmbE family N-acetylglucosaminyl deacetylase
MKTVLLAIALLVTLPLAAQTRAVSRTDGIPSPQSVLWIAAHPDDEAVAAPLLAEWCLREHARCTFLVLTRGQAGTCLRNGGCLPDIATVRAGESAAASEYFHANLILLSLPDGGGSAEPSWASGSERLAVVSQVSEYIAAVRPELILTFDPRHGTTCHPDHRATGSIVMDALAGSPSLSSLYLLETRVTVQSVPFGVRFDAADLDALRFSAAGTPGSPAQAPWAAITEDMKRHPSQFDNSWLTAIDNVLRSDRAVFIAPAEDALRREVGHGCP